MMGYDHDSFVLLPLDALTILGIEVCIGLLFVTGMILAWLYTITPRFYYPLV